MKYTIGLFVLVTEIVSLQAGANGNVRGLVDRFQNQQINSTANGQQGITGAPSGRVKQLIGQFEGTQPQQVNFEESTVVMPLEQAAYYEDSVSAPAEQMGYKTTVPAGIGEDDYYRKTISPVEYTVYAQYPSKPYIDSEAIDSIIQDFMDAVGGTYSVGKTGGSIYSLDDLQDRANFLTKELMLDDADEVSNIATSKKSFIG